MKICIAQSKSVNGNIQEGISNHLKIIDKAIELNADLIVFPELSITGYEPNLAKSLATDLENPIFKPFQELADQNEIVIGIGMPTNSPNGILISMYIFQANKPRTIYSKQILHADELPYFVAGNQELVLNVKKKKVGIGICHETLQPEHFLNAYKNGVDVYIASAAKAESGTRKAHDYFPKMAKVFKTSILMSNSVGSCDNFMSYGSSAAWNKEGELVGQLDDTNEGVLIFDSDSETTNIFKI